MEDFSHRLRFIRTVMLKMSRDEFARLVDFPEITVRSWENKKVIPHSASIQKLIVKLNQQKGFTLTKEWLIDGKGLAPFKGDSGLFGKISEEDIFIEKHKECLLYVVTKDQEDVYFQEGDLLGGLPLKEMPRSQSFYLVQDQNNNGAMIVQAFVSEKTEIILFPLSTLMKKNPIIFDPQDMKLYSLAFFKACSLVS